MTEDRSAAGVSEKRLQQVPRSTKLTAIVGLAMLPLLVIVIVTGFLSHYAQNELQAVPWPTRPVNLYRITQGLHVACGLALVPIVLAKLWTVMPKLFEKPQLKSPRYGIERATTFLLNASILFLLVTGILNIQYSYTFRFSFTVGHFWAAVVLVGALAFHLAWKLREGLSSVRGGTREEDGDDGVVEESREVAAERRRFLGWVFGGAAVLTLVTVGQTAGGIFRKIAFLAPRRVESPPDFPVNKTFLGSRIEPDAIGPGWRLRVTGAVEREMEMSIGEVRALASRSELLPIACVEGWSVERVWTGVTVATLMEVAGARPGSHAVVVRSLEPAGPYRETTLGKKRAADDLTLLAYDVEGAPLSSDHGAPLRLISAAFPGVRQVKWVHEIEVLA